MEKMTQEEAAAWVTSLPRDAGRIRDFILKGDVDAGAQKLLAAMRAIPTADRLEVYETLAVEAAVGCIKGVRALRALFPSLREGSAP